MIPFLGIVLLVSCRQQQEVALVGNEEEEPLVSRTERSEDRGLLTELDAFEARKESLEPKAAAEQWVQLVLEYFALSPEQRKLRKIEFEDIVKRIPGPVSYRLGFYAAPFRFPFVMSCIHAVISVSTGS